MPDIDNIVAREAARRLRQEVGEQLFREIEMADDFDDVEEVPIPVLNNAPLDGIDIPRPVHHIRPRFGRVQKMAEVQPCYNGKSACAHCKKEINLATDKFENYYQNAKIAPDGKLFVVCADCICHFEQCLACKSFYKKQSLKVGFCHSCIERAPETYVHRYGLQVENELGMRGDEPKDRIRYGTELEFETDNLGLDVLIVDGLIKDIAKLKRDSSLKKGFEVVSLPATIEEHYYMWDNFFEKLPATCKPMHTCGMHVHASRDRLSELQIGKILMFLHAKENRNFIQLIAGRESNFHNNFETEKRYLDVTKPLLDKNGRPDHHTALNLHKENTIEFRIFWATRDRRIFLKNIEFCKALIKFTDWATNSLYDSVNYMKFVEFVMARRKDYEYLVLFFNTPSMRKLIEK